MLKIYWPAGASTLLLTDTRTLADRDTDIESAPAPNKATVLKHFKWGKAVWGYDWAKVARVALFDPKQKVTDSMRVQAKAELAKLLTSRRPKIIIVLQTLSQSARKVYGRDAEEEAATDHVGTVVWDFFDPPGPLDECTGCFLDTPYGRVLPVLNPRNMDYVYGAPIRQWLESARDGLQPVAPKQTFIQPGGGMQKALGAILAHVRAGKMLTVDIENFTGSDLITCVGVCAGGISVAVPWHPFQPHGQSYVEPGHADSDEGRLLQECIWEAKTIVTHNGIAHDLPLLQATGTRVNPKTFQFDTYIAHGVAQNQLRHGLQQATSYFYPVFPWKTLYRREQYKRTGLKENDPYYWIQYPEETRLYNCGDTFHNELLAYALWPVVFG